MFPGMPARPCLQEDSYSLGFQWPVIDMLSENTAKLFLVETFTYVKALLIASTSAVKILQPSLSL